jgi:hypothetical protein
MNSWKNGAQFVQPAGRFAQENDLRSRIRIARFSDSFQAFGWHAKASAGARPAASAIGGNSVPAGGEPMEGAGCEPSCPTAMSGQ